MWNALNSRLQPAVDKITDDGLRYSTTQKMKEIVAAEQTFRQEERRLTNDRNLSAQGKSEKIRAAAKEAREKIEAIVARDLYKSDAETILAELPKNEYGDPILLQLQGQEFRRSLENTNPELVKVNYLAEILEGDTPLVRYLETSPCPPDYVTDDTRATSRLVRLALNHPTKAKKLKDLQTAAEAWKIYSNAAIQLLSRYV
ncbi:MAG: hypothetical protein K0A93_08830 [Desulfuromonadaceae bacterium]|nr:hypothetical protein [Desulfuromonadaceae bacterium]